MSANRAETDADCEPLRDFRSHSETKNTDGWAQVTPSVAREPTLFPAIEKTKRLAR